MTLMNKDKSNQRKSKYQILAFVVLILFEKNLNANVFLSEDKIVYRI